MIYGVGVDQVDLIRVRKLLSKSKSKFEKRCFTKNEILYANRFADPAKRLGARFAAKEAVMKSLGKGWRQINWRDIEITGGGKPNVNLLGEAKTLAEVLKIKNVHVSMSHEENQAIAFAISEN
ncbi:MAG: holo-ACP synthase [Actinomycetota bacterium]|nr:holo-ACP synthase [Actinomycetota bacterium]MDA3013302.1 holo-ACP synthase [Actinomycetota bacterium]